MKPRKSPSSYEENFGDHFKDGEVYIFPEAVKSKVNRSWEIEEKKGRLKADSQKRKLRTTVMHVVSKRTGVFSSNYKKELDNLKRKLKQDDKQRKHENAAGINSRSQRKKFRISQLEQKQRMHKGKGRIADEDDEIRILQTIKTALKEMTCKDDMPTFLFHNLEMDRKEKDLIIVHQRLGIIVMEVKSTGKETGDRMDKATNQLIHAQTYLADTVKDALTDNKLHMAIILPRLDEELQLQHRKPQESEGTAVDMGVPTPPDANHPESKADTPVSKEKESKPSSTPAQERFSDHPEITCLHGIDMEKYKTWFEQLTEKDFNSLFEGSTLEEKAAAYKKCCVRLLELAKAEPGKAVKELAKESSKWKLTPDQGELRKLSAEVCHISGAPGTGKTLMLIDRVKQWLQQGRRVVVTTTSERQHLLRNYIRQEIFQKDSEKRREGESPRENLFCVCSSSLELFERLQKQKQEMGRVSVIVDEMVDVRSTYREFLSLYGDKSIQGLWTAHTDQLPDEVKTEVEALGGTTRHLKQCFRCPEHVASWVNCVRDSRRKPQLTHDPLHEQIHDVGLTPKVVWHSMHIKPGENTSYHECSQCKEDLGQYCLDVGLHSKGNTKRTKHLSAQDAVVIVTGNREDKLEEVAQQLRQMGLPAVRKVTDVSSKEESEGTAVDMGVPTPPDANHPESKADTPVSKKKESKPSSTPAQNDLSVGEQSLSVPERSQMEQKTSNIKAGSKREKDALYVYDSTEFLGLERPVVIIVHSDTTDLCYPENRRGTRGREFSQRNSWYDAATRCQGSLFVLVTTPSPLIRVDALKPSQLELTPQQLHTQKSKVDLMHISGPAGSGKTMMLIDRARNWLQQGRQVLIATGADSLNLLKHLEVEIQKAPKQASPQTEVQRKQTARKSEAEQPALSKTAKDPKRSSPDAARPRTPAKKPSNLPAETENESSITERPASKFQEEKHLRRSGNYSGVDSTQSGNETTVHMLFGGWREASNEEDSDEIIYQRGQTTPHHQEVEESAGSNTSKLYQEPANSSATPSTRMGTESAENVSTEEERDRSSGGKSSRMFAGPVQSSLTSPAVKKEIDWTNNVKIFTQISSIVEELDNGILQEPVSVILDEASSDKAYFSLVQLHERGGIQGLWSASTEKIPENMQKCIENAKGTICLLDQCFRGPPFLVDLANGLKPEMKPAIQPTDHYNPLFVVWPKPVVIFHAHHGGTTYSRCHRCKEALKTFFFGLGLPFEQVEMVTGNLTYSDTIAIATGVAVAKLETVAGLLRQLGLPAVREDIDLTQADGISSSELEAERSARIGHVLSGKALYRTEDLKKYNAKPVSWIRPDISSTNDQAHADYREEPVLHVVSPQEFRGLERPVVIVIHDEGSAVSAGRDPRQELFEAVTRCQGNLLIMATTLSPLLESLDISKFQQL